ncbi:TIR domain-containing protein [Pseudomonas fulva]|uniref:TIR domain-containing protein n=1 Tax=Pseudomonas fulva TaxID=47880 RepID=UPI0031F6D3BE
MSKAFLSHNSFDKDFVAEVFSQLGAAKAVYDAETFKKCCDLPQQIREGLEDSDVYVLFLSKTSIQSGWVTAEQDLAFELRAKWKIKSILIFQLDDTGWEHLPSWATKYVVSCPPSPAHVALRISDELRTSKRTENLCYGRDDEKKRLNMAAIDADTVPTHLILSGPTGIGRKTLAEDFYTTLYKHLSPHKIIITYGEHEDIFVLYRKLLGHSAHWRKTDLIEKLSEFSELSPRRQVEAIARIITTITVQFNQVLILDMGTNALGSDDQPLEWLTDLLSRLETKSYPYLVILTNRHFRSDNGIYHQVKALDEENSLYLFKILLQQHEITFPSPNEKKLVETSVIGHPGLITAVVTYLRHNPRYRPNKTQTTILQIINTQVEKMLLDFINEDKEHEKAVALFGDAYIISYAEITGMMSHWPGLEDSVDKLIEAGFVTVRDSYYQLVPYLQRYAQRIGERLVSELNEARKILLSLEETSDNNPFIFTEILDARIIEHLVSGTPLPDHMSGLVMPALQIKAAKKEYDLRNYKNSSHLAKEAYPQARKLSSNGLLEAWRLIGLCAARLADEVDLDYFLKEEPKLPLSKRKSATLHFVLGLKERLQGNLKAALPSFIRCYEAGDIDSHVCRELSYIYAFDGLLDEATNYVKQARQLAPSSPYIIDIEAFILIERYRQKRDPQLLSDLDECLERLAGADLRDGKKFSQIRSSMRDILTNDGTESLIRIYNNRTALPIHTKISLLSALSTKGKLEQFSRLNTEVQDALRNKANKLAEIELAKIRIIHFAHNNEIDEARQILQRYRRKFTDAGIEGLIRTIENARALMSR